MHVPVVPLFHDSTGVAVALMAWARHRCLQLYTVYIFFNVALLRVVEQQCIILGLFHL